MRRDRTCRALPSYLTMRYQTLTIQIDNRVAAIRLNRPEARNALNETAFVEITQAFREVGKEDGVRAVLLAANGSAFCAGVDLNWVKQVAGQTRDDNRMGTAQLAEMLRTVHACPKPVVAKIQGDCYAGGMGLVAACDIAVAVDTACFCVSEVKLGLIPATISPYLIGAIGARAASRYFMTAEKFSAVEAHRIGLVHALGSVDDVDAITDAIIKALISNGPVAVKEAKRLVHDISGMPLTNALIADTVERTSAARFSDEGQEGVRSFLEKRKPDWLR